MTHWAEDSTFLTGPRATSATKVQPADARLAQGIIAGGGVPSGMLNWMLNHLSVMTSGLYGDGSDGDVTLGAGVSALSADALYDNLTVPAAAILEPRGYRVFVRNTLTIDVGGVIRNNGGNGGNASSGTGGTAGASAFSGSIGGTSLPGAAGVGGAGGVGLIGPPATARALGGNGGAGGLAGAFAGGGAGIATPPSAADGTWLIPSPHMGAIASRLAGAMVWLTGGAGGASGAAAAANSASGGGGGPGGVVVICARDIIINGEVQAIGGDAGTAFDAGPAAGGSAGGGGGLIMVLSRTEAGSGAWVVTGGAASAGVAGGGNGVAGSAGRVVRLSA